jgi:hypothetical protein
MMTRDSIQCACGPADLVLICRRLLRKVSRSSVCPDEVVDRLALPGGRETRERPGSKVEEVEIGILLQTLHEISDLAPTPQNGKGLCDMGKAEPAPSKIRHYR